jgi:hypothetical protein
MVAYIWLRRISVSDVNERRDLAGRALVTTVGRD